MTKHQRLEIFNKWNEKELDNDLEYNLISKEGYFQMKEIKHSKAPLWFETFATKVEGFMVEQKEFNKEVKFFMTEQKEFNNLLLSLPTIKKEIKNKK